ncbi:MAG: DUF6514 family protein [Monoglobaceae bacterium]
MRENFKFTTEYGDENTVKFTILKNEGAEKPYGISAVVCETGEKPTVAAERYFTYAEAIAVIDMLCRHQVMPCTLCDII